MSDDKDVEKQLGLDEPIENAVQRFAQLTQDSLDAVGAEEKEIPEGQLDLVPFKGVEIRRVFHDGQWWFSVVDVVGALAGTDRASKYWSDLKKQLIEKEGFSELSDFIGSLPMQAADGRMRSTDAATTEIILRIIQSVPSPKAEPFKRWLAKVGYERIQETQDPEIAIKRAIVSYQIAGRSDEWIERRIRSIVARKALTSEWKKRGVEEGSSFATLTNVIAYETFGVSTARHAKLKGLKRQNLRDHMTDLELIFTMLGESSTKEIAVNRDAQGYLENYHAARDGGSIAGSARKQLEQQTTKKVVSPSNFLGGGQRASDPERLTKAAPDKKPK